MLRRPHATKWFALLASALTGFTPAPSASSPRDTGFGQSSGQPWFVPLAPAKSSLEGGTARVDIQELENEETVVVTAARKPIQRDSRPQEFQAYDPHKSEAGSPELGNSGRGACEGVAYQTIAGQPATGIDLITMGGGKC